MIKQKTKKSNAHIFLFIKFCKPFRQMDPEKLKKATSYEFQE